MKVSDEARKAAATYFAGKFGGGIGEHLTVICDDNSIVQAFARFEAEVRKDERERAAKVAEDYRDSAKQMMQAARNQCDAQAALFHSSAADEAHSIATAIRSLSDDGEGG